MVLVSFRKGFRKGHYSSNYFVLDQANGVLCYEQSDQDAQTLHRVKAHDVRAFTASKAFHVSMSLDQVLWACHWKSQNTFTHFYLKDVAWADSDTFHLGPVVAAQKVHLK